MMRRVQLHHGIVLGDEEVLVELGRDEVGALALEVGLLLHGFAERVSLSSTALLVELAVSPATDRTRASRPHPGCTRFLLARNDAEYLQSVLLRAYRDGAAPTSHIHIEARGPEVDLDLTVLFPLYGPPLSPAEAEKLMR